MADSTPNLGLKKAVDADNARTYLVTDLGGSMDVLDAAVLLTTAQTLTNKTLTSPSISNPTFTGAAAALALGSNTVTADAPPLSIAQTWNSGGVTFTAAKVNITDTASASASKLLDLQVASTSKFFVAKSGNASVGGTALSAWSSVLTVVQIGDTSALIANTSGQAAYLTNNSFYDGAWKAIETNAASRLVLDEGSFAFATAASVSAGSAQTFTNMLYVGLSGNNYSAVGFHPFTDNSVPTGGASNRWTAVWAVNGTIQTSDVDQKNVIEAVRPDLAWESLKATAFFQYTYKPGDEADLNDPIWSRKHWGFDSKVTKWGSPDLETAAPLSVASYIGAALQGYAAQANGRIDKLEAAVLALGGSLN